MNDTVLKQSIIEHLIENFGHVQTERFIFLVNREKFDYTEWRRDLFEDMTIEELSEKAMQHRINKRKMQEMKGK